MTPMINAGMVFLTGTMVGLTTKGGVGQIAQKLVGLEKPRADSVPSQVKPSQKIIERWGPVGFESLLSQAGCL